jgi:WD40 repeat protein
MDGVTPGGSTESGRTTLAPRAAGPAIAALLGLALAGCDQSPLKVPTDPTAVVWTPITTASSVKEPYYPEWRGDSIAFEHVATVAGGGAALRLGIMHDDGASPRFFSGVGIASDIFPRWVNDTTIVFSSNRASSLNYDLWYLTTTSGAARRFTTSSQREFSPAPRPGSPGMAYSTGSEPLKGRIAVIPDTSAVPLVTRFVTPDTMQAGEPDWSPAGDQICFSVQEADGSSHIWKAAISGVDTVLTQLTTGGIHDLSPRWSPDGTKILFSSDRTARAGVWYVSPGGGAPQLIAFEDHGATIYSPSWSPDGKEILLSSDGRGGSRAIWILTNLGF